MKLYKKILLFLSIIVGFSILGLMVYNMNKTDPKKSWPKVKAKITKSDFRSRVVYTDRSSYTKYDLIIEYSYEIDGQKFINISYSNTDNIKSGSFSEIKGLANQYQVDKEIDIFYNSNNPQESFIIYQDSNKIIVYVIFSVLFLVVFPLLIVFGKPAKKQVRYRSYQPRRTTFSSNGVSISF